MESRPVYSERGGCRHLCNRGFSKLGSFTRARNGPHNGGAICLGSYGFSILHRFRFGEFLLGSIYLLQTQMAKWSVLADGGRGVAYCRMR